MTSMCAEVAASAAVRLNRPVYRELRGSGGTDKQTWVVSFGATDTLVGTGFCAPPVAQAAIDTTIELPVSDTNGERPTRAFVAVLPLNITPIRRTPSSGLVRTGAPAGLSPSTSSANGDVVGAGGVVLGGPPGAGGIGVCEV